jgi:glycosyltransferase involved in cell wall biosynthesis
VILMSTGNVVVVLPAYNAERTLARAVAAIPVPYRTRMILVDDASSDRTYQRSVELGLTSIRHERNRGYGGNQKTCYSAALACGADIVVMVHPDGQYDARMIDALTLPIRLGICDIVLGNRIRSRREALAGGMPKRKYLANRLLTGLENVLLGQNLGEFHTGMRAYSGKVLRTLPYQDFSDGFSFDSELLVAAAHFRLRIGDVPVPTIYTSDCSQIGMSDSTSYAVKTLLAVGKFLLQRTRLVSFRMFRPATASPADVPTASFADVPTAFPADVPTASSLDGSDPLTEARAC